jgi:hypothetical protein
MSKVESVVIGIVLSVICPLLLMVLFWWSAASIASFHILQITEKAIAISAIAGLSIGIILDIRFVRTWIPRFYALDLKLMALVYLFCSAIAAAFCMGFLIGNFFLGIVAGVYIGRRSHYSDHGRELFLRLTKGVGMYTAMVTGLWTVSIGLLALNERIVIRMSQELFGITRETLTSHFGVVLVILLGAVLTTLQYWCTMTASKISYRLGDARAT